MPYGTAAIDSIQSSGNLAITGNVTTTGTFALGAQALGTPAAGEFEYDGKVPYFTPLGIQRGVVPGMQYYALNSALVGANATGAQNLLGVGVTLSGSTQYAFEAVYALSKTAGTTAHNFNILFGGTATYNSVNFMFTRSASITSFTDVTAYQQMAGYIQTQNATTLITGSSGASVYITVTTKGIVSINAGGTLIPQYSLSAAPGGAWTTAAGSYFLIYPISAAGSNISVGTWA